MQTNKQKNVLIIISSLKKGGGAENVANYQSRLKKSFNVIYLTFYDHQNSYQPPAPVLCLNEKLTFNPFRQALKLLTRAKKIRKICQQHDIHVAIGHMEASSLPMIIGLLGTKTSTIACIHNFLKRSYPSFWSRFFISILYSLANKLIFVSQGISRGILFYSFIKKKINVIYNAVDLNQFKCPSKLKKQFEQNSLKHRPVHLISVGRLHPQKNYAHTLKALSKLTIPFRYTIIGDGQLKRNLQAKIKNYHLSSSVKLAGPSNKINKILPKHDVFILNSLYEGFGIVLIEAMASGLPVIATDCPYGPREIIAPNESQPIKPGQFFVAQYGILIPVADTISLCKAIEFLVNHPKTYTKLQIAGCQRAKDFSLKRIIPQWETVINDTLL